MSDYQPDVVTVFPHANWRGEYTNGSHPGSQTVNVQCAGQYGCPAISWPGAALTVDGAQAPGTSSPVAWVGSLLGRKTDGSGLQYMRNRYYDPATGKFTQVDPIGLAGGLNLYGFANGDAVNFSDPFGLTIEVADELKSDWEHAKRMLRSAAKAGDKTAKSVLRAIRRAEQSTTVVFSFTVDNSINGYGVTNGTSMSINQRSIQSVENNETNGAATMLHEFGHAYYNATPFKLYDRNTSDGWALEFENAYRRYLRFPERRNHGDYPPFWHP